MGRLLSLLFNPTSSGPPEVIAGRRRRRHPPMPEKTLAGCLLVAAGVPVVSWWVVGDLSTVPDSARPDYFMKAPKLTAAVEALIGVTGVGIAAAGAFVLSRHRTPNLAGVIVPLAVAGVIVGYTFRVFTAGVIGANIGAGLMLIQGLPLALWLYGMAVRRSGVLFIGRR